MAFQADDYAMKGQNMNFGRIQLAAGQYAVYITGCPSLHWPTHKKIRRIFSGKFFSLL